MKNIRFIHFMAIVLILSGAILGCSKMNDTYKEFLEGGQTKYVGKADSVQVLPGRNRVYIRWQKSADPSVTRARIFWNNRLDSMEVPLTNFGDIVIIPIENIPEGNYTFEIITLDNEGNRSVMVETRGRSYGNSYERMLLNRTIVGTEFVDANTLRVLWSPATDTTLMRSNVVYRNDLGELDTISINRLDQETILPNFSRGMLRYRSFYMPSSLSVDTFYTRNDSLRVKGIPMEMSRTGWTATASSEDVNGNRTASRVLDGSTAAASIWVNQLSPQTFYPHTLDIDLGATPDVSIEGFIITSRVNIPAARPRNVEFLTSEDGEIWVSHGDYALENSPNKQWISIPESATGRYVRFMFKSAHDNGNNVAVAEIGLFTR